MAVGSPVIVTPTALSLRSCSTSPTNRNATTEPQIWHNVLKGEATVNKMLVPFLTKDMGMSVAKYVFV